ncbi:MAG: hypothetical protein NZM42_11555 [Gemmatales bacterium]|nr:hypothetical protein [Gemmatales bacterium]
MALRQVLAWARPLGSLLVSVVGRLIKGKRRSEPSYSAPLGVEILEARSNPSVSHRLVANIQPGSVSSSPEQLTNVSGTVYFVANSPSQGWQLWRSDGTSSGTFLVRVIGPGTTASRPRYLTNVNGTLFFVANDGSGDRIWRSQGDAASTVPIPALTAGLSDPKYLANLNNTLYFAANSSSVGRELFRAASSLSGATLVADIHPSGSANPMDLFPFGNKLLFAANDGTSGRELWAHDALNNQTYRVADINPGSGHSYPSEFVACGGLVFFAATNPSKGRELWATDGTSGNALLVADINPGAGLSSPRYLTNVNNRLLFNATPNIATGPELFLHDPALGTTQLLKDIRSSGGSNPRALTNVNGTLFFAAHDGVHGYELWLSDLTPAGTVLAIDFFTAGSGLGISDVIGQMVNSNGILFLAANDGSSGMELFIAYTPSKVVSITPPANGLYGLGSTLTFTVRFDKPVTVTGTPRLRFSFTDGSGTQQRDAVYVSGSGSDTLSFHYTVSSGDHAPNGITLTSPLLVPGGASITDMAGNAAMLTFTAVHAADVQLDGIAPTVVSVTAPSAGMYGPGEHFDFIVQFSENVVIAGAPRLPLFIGSGSRHALYLGNISANILRFRYTVQPGDSDPDGIQTGSSIELNGGSIQDAAGNNAVLNFAPPDTSGVKVGVVPVSIIAISPPAAGTYYIGQVMTFAVNFTGVVTVTGLPRLRVEIGDKVREATYKSGSSTATLYFTYVVRRGDYDRDGVGVLSLAMPLGSRLQGVSGIDLSFSPFVAGGVLVNGITPQVENLRLPRARRYVTGDVLEFRLQFTEPVFLISINGSTPRLRLQVGHQIVYATYVLGSGSNALVFRYRVEASDSGALRVLSPLDLNGSLLRTRRNMEVLTVFAAPLSTGITVN